MGNYNEFAGRYEELTEKFEGEARSRFRSLIVEPLSGKRLLDVGCGSGFDAQYYAERGAKVFGVDISEVELNMAKKKVPWGNFFLGDMKRLPFEENFFDLITSVYALQSSDDVIKSLNEMIRVVKSGSQILILTKHPFRNLIESHINDKRSDYYEARKVTSYIFDRAIKLSEPGHTLMEYLHPSVLGAANLERLTEHSDFPLSEQVIPGLNYPTYMVLAFRKI